MTSHHLSLQASSRLESLRGLAAIQVAMFHSLLVLESAQVDQTFVPTLITLFNGRSAVTLFFVLSGLVLGLSLQRSVAAAKDVWLSFALRRLFRIYPAFLVSTVITCAVIYLYPRYLPLAESKWADSFLADSFNFKVLAENLCFWKHDLNGVTWTLRMEMVCSLLLPICFFGGRLSPVIPWLILLMCVALAFIFPTVVSIVVMQAFLIGYLVPYSREIWHRFSTNNYTATATSGGALCLLLITRSWHWPFSITTLLEAIGAAALICSVTYGFSISAFAILDKHLIKVAGRISYSYYLFHPAALILVSKIFLPTLLQTTGHKDPVFCATILWVMSSALAFPLAWLSYERVEKPMITFSKSLYPHSPVHKPVV